MALIRKEVAANRATQHYGTVVLAVERSSSLILLVAMGFLGAVLALASCFSYTSRVHVSGVIEGGGAGAAVVLLVPPHQAPRVRVGQTVHLRLACDAPGATGQMTGTVSALGGVSAGAQRGASVTVAIGAHEGGHSPAGVQWQPGTALDADIDVERHRLIAWLFRPMLHVLEQID